MALDFLIPDDTAYTALPEPVREHYVKSPEDGKYYLQANGLVPKAKLEEFRTNNTTIMKERDELKTRYNGIDPEEYKTLKERKDLLDQGKLVSAEGVDAAVKKRVEAMTTDHQKALDGIAQRAAAAERKVAEFMIDGELLKAGAEAGLRTTATQDLILRGRAIFSMQEGKLVAIGPDGQPLYGANAETLTPREYVENLTKQAPHLFDASTGTGAGGKTDKTASIGGDNPYRAATWNLTKQAIMQRDEPTKAAKLKAQALAAGETGPLRK